MEKLQSKLFEAATQNSITSLHQLLKDDPLILDRSFINSFNETPLHVAAMLGHLDFVKEIIKIKPQLVNKLNSHRSSPLHLASANGHVDVVKALLSVHSRACFERDRNDMSPLHLAAANGHVEALKLLLEAQPGAMYGGGGESILHLCVKRHQLEALRLLVMKSDCDKELVNSKDSDGNTLLHLAVADKQIETIRFVMSVGVVEVNAVNDEGKTAMDVLIGSRRDLRDSEIEKSLTNAGGLGTQKAAETKKKSSQKTSTEKDYHTDWMENKKNSLMVVASLIATMAFQIGVNPPGGLWQDDKMLVDKEGKSYLAAAAGTSVYLHRNPQGYKEFYIVNTTAFVASLSTILFLTSGLPLRRKIYVLILTVIMWVPIIAIVTCYVLAIVMVTPAPSKENSVEGSISMIEVLLNTLAVWIVLIALLLITHIIRFIMMLVRKMRKVWSRRRRSPPTSTGLGLVAP